MTAAEVLETAAELVQIALLLLSLILGFRYARRTERNLYLIFYAMAMAAFLCSDLYWFAHMELQDGLRVPFAADDIADFGLFLLLGSSLGAAMERRERPLGVTVVAALFAAANVALWIGWSGEWLRDLFGGVAYGYFLVVTAQTLVTTGALLRWEKLTFPALCVLIVAAMALTILGPEEVRGPMDLTGYVLLFAVLAWTLLRALVSLRSANADRTLAICFAAFAWTTVAMYMSDGVWYMVAAHLTDLDLLLMLLAVRKKVRAA